MSLPRSASEYVEANGSPPIASGDAMKKHSDHSGENKPKLCSRIFQPDPDSAPRLAPKCDPVQPNIPGRSQAFPQTESDKTNPTAAFSLTPRQLAAARLLCRGMSTDAAAAQLQTTRQTINRWRRLPAFAKEIQRLHDVLAIRAAEAREAHRLATPLAASGALGLPPRATGLKVASARESAREERVKQRRFDAMMDRLLAPPRAAR